MDMASLIRVAIVDDHPVVTEGLAASLMQGHGDELVVVGTASSVAGLDRLVEATRPDIVLLDVMFPNGPVDFDRIARLRKRSPAPAVVILSSYDSPAFVVAALRAGASGYLPKTTTIEGIVVALHDVIRGRQVIPESLRRRARSSPRPPTHRELTIIRAAASGGSNGEIASELGLTPKTVEGYLHEMYERFGVSSRAHLVALAMEQGWLLPIATHGPRT